MKREDTIRDIHGLDAEQAALVGFSTNRILASNCHLWKVARPFGLPHRASHPKQH